MTVADLALFDGFDKVKTSDSGPKITAGKYRLAINNFKYFDSRKNPGEKWFAVEFTILHTTAPDYAEGEEVTWLQNMTRKVSFENIKGLIMAINPGMTEDQIGKEEIVDLLSPENPASGIVVDCRAHDVTSKNGNPYVKCAWSEAKGDWQHKSPELVAGAPAASDSEDIPY